MRVRLTAAALVVAAAALCLALPGASHAAEKAIWGPVELPGGNSAFPTYRKLGVDTLQLQLSFATTAPTRPANPSDPADLAYRWPERLDQAMAGGQSTGINIALLVSQSPAWANGGRSAIHAPDPRAFAAFMTAAAQRYPAVRRWMIWGEPNRDDRFLPNAEGSAVGPRAYAPILDSAYRALKAVSRRNIVIGGMTWTGGTVKPAQFLRDMRLPNGRPPRLDWYGHNPFPFRFPNLREIAVGGGFRDISDLDVFTRQLRRVYGKRARFWLSEFLVLSDKGSSTFELSVTRRQQARWLAAAYGIADRLPSVAGLGWLSLLDESPRPGGSNWGLLDSGGQPKPAFRAFRAARSEHLRPSVRAARRIGRGRLQTRGLRVGVRVRASGPVSVQLRRSGTLVARRTLRGVESRRRTATLRSRRARRGRYVLIVRAPRGATVRRTVSIR